MAKRIEDLANLADFDSETGIGKVILNVTYVPEEETETALGILGTALDSPYGMGGKIVVARPGDSLGRFTVPENMVGMGTVCSMTLNGVLARAGVPVSSRFGGIVEVEDDRPVRWLSAISYEASASAPLEILMKTRTTDVLGAMRYGRGKVLASFREIPEAGLDDAARLGSALERCGFCRAVTFGLPGRPLLNVPVAPGRVGMLVFGGLNPVAALREEGIVVETHAMAMVYDYSKLRRTDDFAGKGFSFPGLRKAWMLDHLPVGEVKSRSDYWSVFEGLKQITL